MIKDLTRVLGVFSVVVLGLAPGARADFLLPNHNHTETVQNNTGKTANDLHVNLIHPSTGAAPTATGGFGAGNLGATSIDFAGGSVANGGSSSVGWRSKFASDTIDPNDPGHWTSNGTDIGAVTLPASASLNYTPDGGGGVIVRLVNSGSTAINYTGLQIATNVSGNFDNTGTYLNTIGTGTPVALLVPTSGSFAPFSFTAIADFTPSMSASTYNAGEAVLNGYLFGAGAAVPEPSPATLLAMLTPVLTVALRKFKRREV